MSHDFTAAPSHQKPSVGTASPSQLGAATSLPSRGAIVAGETGPLVILRCGGCGVMLKREGLWISCPECGATEGQLRERAKVIAYPVPESRHSLRSMYGSLDEMMADEAARAPQVERARELARPYFAEVGQAAPEPIGLSRISRWVWRQTFGRREGRSVPLDSFARGLEWDG